MKLNENRSKYDKLTLKLNLRLKEGGEKIKEQIKIIDADEYARKRSLVVSVINIQSMLVERFIHDKSKHDYGKSIAKHKNSSYMEIVANKIPLSWISSYKDEPAFESFVDSLWAKHNNPEAEKYFLLTQELISCSV